MSETPSANQTVDEVVGAPVNILAKKPYLAHLTVGLVIFGIVSVLFGAVWIALPDDSTPDRYEAPFYIETSHGSYYAIAYQISPQGVLVIQRYTDKLMQGVLVVVDGPFDISYRLPENMLPQNTTEPTPE